MFGNFAKLDSPQWLVQFFQTSLVVLIPNCTRHRMITYILINKQLLDEVIVKSRIIKVEVSIISRAEGEIDNTYRDLDNQ
jgi:hypothetical protein